MTPTLSVVIPVYNEEANIGPLAEELVSVLDGLNRSWEIIWVDDGSTDETFRALEDTRAQASADNRERIRLIRLARNSGQTVALSAGFDHARGDIIVTLDGDGQNDPADIPALLATLDSPSEYDLVCGWRRGRRDPWLTRRVPSFLGNALVRRMTAIRLHDFGCTLKAFRRDLVHDVALYGQTHRLLPVLLAWKGARYTEQEVAYRPRQAGQSKYSLYRSVIVILDLITLKFFLSYATRPLHIFGLAGLVSIFLSGLGLAGVVFMKVSQGIDMTGNPLLTITVLLIIVGVQFVALGLLGEVNVRTYYETQHKPTYHVVKVVGGGTDAAAPATPVAEVGRRTRA